MKLHSALISMFLATQVLGDDSLDFLRTQEEHGRILDGPGPAPTPICAPFPLLEPKPDVSYNPVPDANLLQEFVPNIVGESDLKLTFDYNHPSYDLPLGAGPRLEAVVYGWDFLNNRCLFDTPLAKTPGAHIAPGINSFPSPLPITINGASSMTPVAPIDLVNPAVYLDIPFETFGSTFYQQLPNAEIGYLNICVELQVLVCDVKLDFVDVHVKVGFKLKEDCESDCLDVTEVRADPINDELGPLDFVNIKCEPCGVAGAVTITQGTQVDACLKIINIGAVQGTCILSIDEFDFVLGTKTYDIVPAFDADIPMTGTGATCGGSDGCKVSFLTDASDFQLLNPKENGQCPVPPCSATGFFRGAVTIGIGSVCNPARRHLRELQEGETTVLKFDGVPFTLAVEKAEGCTAFFLVCLIQAILAWFTSLFSF